MDISSSISQVEKKPNLTQVEIVKPKPVESKRAFKEKQQILFSDSNNKLPLLEFLEQHDSEIINHDEESLNALLLSTDFGLTIST